MQTDADIKRIISYFKARKEVTTLYLFGSCAKGRALPGSDIDVAVLIDEKKIQRSNYLKHRVIKTGKVLFDRNRKPRVRFTTQAITEYLDFKPIEDIFNKAVANRFRKKSLSAVTK
ncbi:MAG: hypothetical protein C4538_02460 [Nitrospiraceae bacterium]|nr:MAG: hypothetical protein C4538_02460 [Nitrospiraceae bacterium]